MNTVTTRLAGRVRAAALTLTLAAAAARATVTVTDLRVGGRIEGENITFDLQFRADVQRAFRFGFFGGRGAAAADTVPLVAGDVAILNMRSPQRGAVLGHGRAGLR